MISRKELLHTLVNVINQACQIKYERGYCYIHHSFLSAYEEAFVVLEKEGLIEEGAKGEWKILWDKLEEIKEEAVI